MPKFLMACAAAAFMAVPATAQTWSSNAPQIGPISQPEGVVIQSYPASANYCPQGLQPVTLGGVICCGTPNAAYSQPAHAPRASSCPAGVKGCS